MNNEFALLAVVELLVVIAIIVMAAVIVQMDSVAAAVMGFFS